jgi:cytoskeletal protein CcmA (bactofilin family)
MFIASSVFWYSPGHAYKEFKAGNFRAGANVTVKENEVISEELTVAGANVTVAGSLKQGLNAFGANVNIAGSVAGELNAFGANIVFSGEFRNKVNAAAATIVLNGTFDGTVEAAAAKVTIMPATVIKGNLNYAAAILDRQEGSRVLGEIIRKEAKAGDENTRRKFKKVATAIQGIVWFLSIAALLIVGLIVNAFFPKQTESVVVQISGSPWKNIAAGFIFLVAAPVAIIVAFITVIGIPAGIIAGFLYGFILYISRIYIGIWIGRKIIASVKKSQASQFFWPLTVGILTIALIGLIPLLGWMFKLFCLLIGLGAMCLAAWRSIQTKS